MRPNDGLIVDSNLLVLLVVGLTSRALIGKHLNTKSFTAPDFDLLIELISDHKCSITPTIAAETSNLLGQDRKKEPDRSRIFKMFEHVLETWFESYEPSGLVAKLPEFSRLGLTDTAILLAAERRHIVTTDLHLFLSASARGIDVTNFHHLREARGIV
jgi:hypothetical protein